MRNMKTFKEFILEASKIDLFNGSKSLGRKSIDVEYLSREKSIDNISHIELDSIEYFSTNRLTKYLGQDVLQLKSSDNRILYITTDLKKAIFD